MDYRNLEHDYFYVVKKEDTVSKVLAKTFQISSAEDLERRLKEIAPLNPHIRDLDQIRPGQLLRLGVNHGTCRATPPNAAEMAELERVYRSLPAPVQNLIEENSDYLDYLGYLIKYADYFIDKGSALNEHRVRTLPPGRLLVTLEQIRQLHVQTMVTTFAAIRSDRILLQQRLGIRVVEKNIIRITVDDSGVRGYVRQLEKLGKIASALKWGGRIVKAADLYLDAKEIYNAPTREARENTIVKTVLKNSAGPVVGAATTYLVCNLAFGIETVGTSLFWCGAIAGGTGALIGGGAAESLANPLLESKLGNRFVRGTFNLFSSTPAY